MQATLLLWGFTGALWHFKLIVIAGRTFLKYTQTRLIYIAFYSDYIVIAKRDLQHCT